MGADYVSRLKAHLGTYKATTLGITEEGRWGDGDKTYAHILPPGEYRLNLLPVIERTFWEWHEKQGAAAPKKHRDFAHLNSSQAMCFNLFFPIIDGGEAASSLLLGAFGLPGLEARALEFEKVPDKGEGTSLDFYFETDLGARIFVEAKLTESSFGRAKPDKEHLRKRKEIYLKDGELARRIDQGLLDPEAFFAHYQLLRNLWTLKRERDRLVVLFPRARRELGREVDAFKKHILSPWKKRVRVVFIEDLCSEIRRLAAEKRLSRICEAMDQFEAKYCPKALGAEVD